MDALWFPDDAAVRRSVRLFDLSDLRVTLIGFRTGDDLRRAFHEARAKSGAVIPEDLAMVQAFVYDEPEKLRLMAGAFPTEILFAPALAKRLASAALAKTCYCVGRLSGLADPFGSEPNWGVGVTADLAEASTDRPAENPPHIHLAAKSDEALLTVSVAFKRPWPTEVQQRRLCELFTLDLLLLLANLPQIPLDVGGLSIEGLPGGHPQLGGMESDDLVEFPPHSCRFILEPARTTYSSASY